MDEPRLAPKPTINRLLMVALSRRLGESLRSGMEYQHRARSQCNGARNRIEAIMTDHFFDHDRLDVYRLSIEYVATALETSRS